MWSHWHASQNGAVKGKHAVAMRFLTAGHWAEPHFKLLQGKLLKGLGEICIHGEVEWRLIGHRKPSEDLFTVLMICNHKNRVYKPKDALATASRRWKDMQNGLMGTVLDVHPG